ncbi:S8 family serine peptidase [Gardnerella vaginalis]|uniref:S8 family serine peptidase n=1 Tax=Gardnerella vaginalis TaxID=2702 RepID=UPI0039F06104
MKFKRTSYLTRLAALGVAAATLIVPLSGLTTAYAKTVSNVNVNKKSDKTTIAGANKLLSKAADSGHVPTEAEIKRAIKDFAENKKNEDAEESYKGSLLEKAIEDYKKAYKNEFDFNSKEEVNVVVTLKGKSGTGKSVALERKNQQNKLLPQWCKKYKMKVRRQLGYLVNAFEVTMPQNMVLGLRKEPEVESAHKARKFQTMENNARVLQGVSEAFKKYKLDGTGMLVSIIDTGIDMNQPDMKLDESAKAHIKMKPKPGFTDKVPDGYNFADQNDNVRDDISEEQHGMHVAGIVAANGDETGKPADKNWRVDGVAPNAQLLAMKVFSNEASRAGGADDADIAAAVEKSVELGADIINMSLGSINGFSGASNITGLALKKARAAGVLPVISAGNSGLNFSSNGEIDDVFGKLDDATLGTPSAFPEAFSVASVENSVMTEKKATYKVDGSSKGTDILYRLATGKPDGQEREVVSVGYGRSYDDDSDDPDIDEYDGINVHDKYVLVERGKINFATKFKHAFEAGAAGILVYNNDKGTEQFLGMAGIEGFGKKFGVSIRRTDALKMLDDLKQNKKVKISFSNDYVSAPNPDSMHPSGFSSWGSTPELDFKPNIAGIGGNVFSTQNGKGNYVNMSGTSMAAPNVSGLSALMVQYYKNRFHSISRVERAKRATQALMNTAKILTDDGKDTGVPYVPRQIGAGLAQVDKAMDTNVIATVNGESYVPLREVNGERTIKVDLHNYGSKDLTFNVPAQQVLNESNEANKNTVTNISKNEDLTPQNCNGSILVKANSVATVEFKLKPNTSSNHYIEGYIRFESKDSNQPNISVPYLGFVGDWNKEPILVDPSKEYSSDIKASTTLVSAVSNTNKVKVNREGEATKLGSFSPNKDKLLDTIIPSVMMFRSAEEVRYSIYDSKGNLVKDLGYDNYLSRSDYRSLKGNAHGNESSTGEWDGSEYDPKTGKEVIAPDGIYTYKVIAKLSKNSDRSQTYTMKVGLDTKAPKIKVSDRDSNGDVIITVTDDLSETYVPDIHINGKWSAVKNVDKTCQEKDDKGACKLNFDPSNPATKHTYKVHIGSDAKFLYVSTKDSAENTSGYVYKIFKDSKDSKDVVINGASKLASKTMAIRFMSKFDGDNNLYLPIGGYASDDVKDIKVSVTYKDNGNKTVTVDDEHKKFFKDKSAFAAYVPLENGVNHIVVTGLNNERKPIGNDEVDVTFNAHAPNITVTNLNKNNNLDVLKNGEVTIKGKVTDDKGDKLSMHLDYVKTAQTPDGGVSVGSGSSSGEFVDPDDVKLNDDGSFEVTIKPDATAYTVTLTASDGANDSSKVFALEGRTKPVDKFDSEVHRIFSKDYDFEIDKESANKFEGMNTYIIQPKLEDGKPNPNISGNSFTVTGKVGPKISNIVFTPSAEVVDGHMKLKDPIVAVIKDGRFTVTLPMHVGINDFRMQLKEKVKKEGSTEELERSFLDTKVRFYFDVNPAKAVFNTPKLYGNTLFTNQDSVDFKGSMSQDCFGYSLFINGSIVSEFFSTDGGGEKVNKSLFNKNFSVKDKDIIHVEVNNTTASSLETFIPVVVDKKDPEVNIGVESNKTISDNRSIKVKVKDNNLQLAKVYVDGKVVASAENNLVQKNIEDILVDSDNSKDNAAVVASKPGKTEFSLDIPTADLNNGSHTIKVEAVDYAGNITTNTNANSDTVSKVIVIDRKKDTPQDPSEHSGSSNTSVNPPAESTQAPKAPESIANLKQSLKGNLVVGNRLNNVARAGKSNPVVMLIAGMNDSAESGSSNTKVSSDTSAFINQLKKNKLAYAYAYIYSSPVLLHGKDGSKYVTVTLGDDGLPRFDAKIPEGYSGKHTIVLLDEKGSQIAWTTVWVIPANATSFAETIAEDNLKYSENNFGSSFGSSSGSSSGFGFDSDYENYVSSSNVANDDLISGGSSADGSAGGSNADANGSGNKSGSRSKANVSAKSGTSNSASSKETNANSVLSKLSATGVGTVSTMVTVTLLMLIGAFALIASRLRNRSIK